MKKHYLAITILVIMFVVKLQATKVMDLAEVKLEASEIFRNCPILTTDKTAEKILFIGSSRAGKSTLVNALQGLPIQCTAGRGNAFHMKVAARVQDYCKIGNAQESFTVYPKILTKETADGVLEYYDSPGFYDDRGLAHQIAISRLLQKIVTNNSVKVVVVCAQAIFDADRHEEFFNILNDVFRFFSIEKHGNFRSFGLIITQCEKEYSLEDFQNENMLGEGDIVSRWRREHKTKGVVDFFASLLDDRIRLFHQPAKINDRYVLDADETDICDINLLISCLQPLRVNEVRHVLSARHYSNLQNIIRSYFDKIYSKYMQECTSSIPYCSSVEEFKEYYSHLSLEHLRNFFDDTKNMHYNVVYIKTLYPLEYRCLQEEILNSRGDKTLEKLKDGLRINFLDFWITRCCYVIDTEINTSIIEGCETNIQSQEEQLTKFSFEQLSNEDEFIELCTIFAIASPKFIEHFNKIAKQFMAWQQAKLKFVQLTIAKIQRGESLDELLQEDNARNSQRIALIERAREKEKRNRQNILQECDSLKKELEEHKLRLNHLRAKYVDSGDRWKNLNVQLDRLYNEQLCLSSERASLDINSTIIAKKRKISQAYDTYNGEFPRIEREYSQLTVDLPLPKNVLTLIAQRESLASNYAESCNLLRSSNIVREVDLEEDVIASIKNEIASISSFSEMHRLSELLNGLQQAQSTETITTNCNAIHDILGHYKDNKVSRTVACKQCSGHDKSTYSKFYYWADANEKLIELKRYYNPDTNHDVSRYDGGIKEIKTPRWSKWVTLGFTSLYDWYDIRFKYWHKPNRDQCTDKWKMVKYEQKLDGIKKLISRIEQIVSDIKEENGKNATRFQERLNKDRNQYDTSYSQINSQINETEAVLAALTEAKKDRESKVAKADQTLESTLAKIEKEFTTSQTSKGARVKELDKKIQETSGDISNTLDSIRSILTVIHSYEIAQDNIGNLTTILEDRQQQKKNLDITISRYQQNIERIKQLQLFCRPDVQVEHCETQEDDYIQAEYRLG